MHANVTAKVVSGTRIAIIATIRHALITILDVTWETFARDLGATVHGALDVAAIFAL